MPQEREEKLPADRRVDYQKRLRYAVRKAHDRLFDILSPQETRGSASGANHADRVYFDQQLGQKKRVNGDER